MGNFESKVTIDDDVLFTPMYRHCQTMGIEPEEMYGTVVAVKFTKAKVFYDILDDYYCEVFTNVDSTHVSKVIINTSRCIG